MAFDRRETIITAAKKAATDYYDNVLVKGQLFPQKMNELLAVGGGTREGAIDALAKQYAVAIGRDLPADTWSDADAATILSADPKAVYEFAEGRGESPILTKAKKDFKDFQELATDGNWRNLDKETLEAKAAALGFNINSPEQRKAFQTKLNEYETAMRKQAVVDEFAQSAPGYVARYAFPTAYEEAVRQALTDAPYDEGAVAKGAALDLGVNSAIMATPGLGVASRVPLRPGNLLTKELLPGSTTPFAGAYQALMEGGRQGVKQLIDPELEGDLGAVIATGTAGATVPGLALGAQGLVSKLQAPWARQLARGFSKGARGVDPQAEERNIVKQSLIDARKLVKEEGRRAEEAIRSGGKADLVERGFGYGSYSDYGAYDKAAKYLKDLGYTDDGIKRIIGEHPKIVDWDNMGGKAIEFRDPTLDVETAMRAYDTPRVFMSEGPAILSFPTAAEAEATKAAREAYGASFPFKAAEEELEQSLLGASRAPMYVGRALGEAAGKLGGSVEPAMHVESSASAKSFKKNQYAYKDTGWYKNMKKQSPQLAEAFDAEMKRKMEDEE